MLHIGRDLLFHVCFHLGVEHVGFADGKNPFLYKEFRVVLLQFVQQDSVFLCDIVAVGRDHEQQNGVPLYVPEESQPYALALMCAFDYSRDISNDERLVVIVPDNSEIRLKGGKCVVGDFRFGRCHRCEQGRFPCIRESDKSHICKHFQL